MQAAHMLNSSDEDDNSIALVRIIRKLQDRQWDFSTEYAYKERYVAVDNQAHMRSVPYYDLCFLREERDDYIVNKYLRLRNKIILGIKFYNYLSLGKRKTH